MVEDLLPEIQSFFDSELKEAISALELLKLHFGEETVSAAIGEISEKLLARYYKIERAKRGSHGYDLFCPINGGIEVKSRLISRWGNRLQFNFGKHTALNAKVAYCVVWNDNPNLKIEHIFKLSVKDLCDSWGCSQDKYCARTDLGKLREALKATQVQKVI